MTSIDSESPDAWFRLDKGRLELGGTWTIGASARLDRELRGLEVPAGDIANAIDGLIGWDGRRTVDRLAPDRLSTPAGSSHPIDYAADGGPTVELRPQALFGLSVHPTVGGG